MTCVNTFSVLLILTKKVFENLLCNLEVKVNQTLLGWFSLMFVLNSSDLHPSWLSLLKFDFFSNIKTRVMLSQNQLTETYTYRVFL
jgi:hypothetical protein